MCLQGNLRQDDFPTLSGGPQGPGGPPDGAGRHPAYDEDERHYLQPPGMLCCRSSIKTWLLRCACPCCST